MTKGKVYGCLFVLILCFIFSNSMLSKETSGKISHFVMDLLIIGGTEPEGKPEEELGGDSAGELGGDSMGELPEDEEHLLVRKMAHLIEYAVLGAVSYLFVDSLTKDKYKKYVTLTLVGVAVPLIDETIQILFERGPALIDVWIDAGGYLIGALAVFLAFVLAHKAFGRKGEA